MHDQQGTTNEVEYNDGIEGVVSAAYALRTSQIFGIIDRGDINSETGVSHYSVQNVEEANHVCDDSGCEWDKIEQDGDDHEGADGVPQFGAF
jgi:hypothetical protein